MTTPNRPEPTKIGTMVKILNSGFHRAQIVEDFGELGPKGARSYHVLVVKKPRMYVQVLEDQLEVLPEVLDLLPPN